MTSVSLMSPRGRHSKKISLCAFSASFGPALFTLGTGFQQNQAVSIWIRLIQKKTCLLPVFSILRENPEDWIGDICCGLLVLVVELCFLCLLFTHIREAQSGLLHQLPQKNNWLRINHLSLRTVLTYLDTYTIMELGYGYCATDPTQWQMCIIYSARQWFSLHHICQKFIREILFS